MLDLWLLCRIWECENKPVALGQHVIRHLLSGKAEDPFVSEDGEALRVERGRIDSEERKYNRGSLLPICSISTK